LHEARRETADSLARQVEKVTAEPARPTTRDRLLDRRELRGWPCAGSGIDGAISQTVPGWNLGLDD
jgi:hypothetical protein